ncbi:MAG: GNAT family N-acetyltransferase [Blastocatellales bacterium]
MKVLETERLVLRRMNADDAAFILELLNEPSFLQYIGDKRVRTLEDARGYIASGPMASYDRFGFGLYLVELKTDGTPIGMSGLLKRDTLPDVDLGYALSPKHWGKGYAVEAARATLEHGKKDFGLIRIVAITTPDNHSSIKVLERIGFEFEAMVRLSEDSDEVTLFGCAL